jgi:hypothetical protein
MKNTKPLLVQGFCIIVQDTPLIADSAADAWQSLRHEVIESAYTSVVCIYLLFLFTLPVHYSNLKPVTWH